MTVGEIVDLLSGVERDRTVYVPGPDMKAEPVAMVIDLKHVNFPPGMQGISIPDDVALLPQSMEDRIQDEDEE
jgi:hypothetical protein